MTVLLSFGLFVVIISISLLTFGLLKLRFKYRKSQEELSAVRKEMQSILAEKVEIINELRNLENSINIERAQVKQLHEEEIQKLKNIYNNELSHRKSAEIRLGKISETLAPFLEDWPWDPKDFRFLGTPLDGIQFSNDEIIFVEIKTGKSRLTTKQQFYKKLVIEKKVSFAVFRLTDNGGTLVKE